MDKAGKCNVVLGNQPEILWWTKNEAGPLRDEFHFLQLRRKFGFLLRFFPLCNRLAERAGMLAVEGSGHRFEQGGSLDIFRDHVRPR